MSDQFSPWDEAYRRPEAPVRERMFTAPGGKSLKLALRELGTLEAFQASDRFEEYVERYVAQKESILGPDGTTFPASRGVFQLVAMLETMQANEPRITMLDWLAIASRVPALWSEIVRWMAEISPQVDEEGNSPRSGLTTDAGIGRSSEPSPASDSPTPN